MLSTFGPKDRFTLVLASRPKQPLLREVELEHVDDVVRTVRDVQASDVLGAWEPIFAAVDELIASGSYPLHEVTLVTDLRRAGWEANLAELGNRWAAGHVRLRVFDVGTPETNNVALVSLEQVDRLALAGTLPRGSRPKCATTRAATWRAWRPISSSTASPRWFACPTIGRRRNASSCRWWRRFRSRASTHVAFELPADALTGRQRAQRRGASPRRA